MAMTAMSEPIRWGMLKPGLVRVAWLFMHVQVLLSLILAVMVGLAVSKLGWGDKGHVVKADMYPLLTFGYMSLIYVVCAVIFGHLSWCLFQYDVTDNASFLIVDAFLGTGLLISSSWIASGVLRAPGPGTEHYAAHTTCPPYQQYLNDLVGAGYDYDEHTQLNLEASDMLGSCMADMTAYCIGFILAVTYIGMALIRHKLRKNAKRQVRKLRTRPSRQGSILKDVETDSTAKTIRVDEWEERCDEEKHSHDL